VRGRSAKNLQYIDIKDFDVNMSAEKAFCVPRLRVGCFRPERRGNAPQPGEGLLG
jgi:hypothetical protein